MQQFTVRVVPSFLIFPISLLTVSNWANVKENKLFGRLSNMYLTMKLIFIDKSHKFFAIKTWNMNFPTSTIHYKTFYKQLFRVKQIKDDI